MLASAPSGQEWYEAEFELPPELFKFDFVIMDKATGGVDNNRARVSAKKCTDYVFPHAGYRGDARLTVSPKQLAM
jgi:hypothetical protein